MSQPGRGCSFCQIVAGERPAARVYEDELTLAFLDHRPLLKGHLLLVPRRHVETLDHLPAAILGPLFGVAQLLARAVQRGLEADGAFVAVNVRVSQSVPHLHVHVVPRWEGDGLFSPKMIWKRRPYRDDEERRAFQIRIQEAIRALGGPAR